MTPEQFTYWLNGFLELENPKTLNLRQTKVIKDHLKKVFEKQTPTRNNTHRSSKKNTGYNSGSALIC